MTARPTERPVSSIGSLRIFESSPSQTAGTRPALNRGFGEARGDYLAKCDADDIWVPEKLERRAGCLVPTPGHRYRLRGSEVLRPHRGPAGPVPRAPAYSIRRTDGRLYRANSICASSTLVRRDHVSNGSARSLRDLAAEDYDYWLRALGVGARFFYDPEGARPLPPAPPERLLGQARNASRRVACTPTSCGSAEAPGPHPPCAGTRPPTHRP